MTYLRKQFGALVLAVIGPFLLGGTCLADVALVPNKDTAVKSWPYPSGSHYTAVASSNGVFISTYPPVTVGTDQYEMTSTTAPRQGGHFSIRVKEDSLVFDGLIQLAEREGSAWPKAPDQEVPGDETWHSFSPALQNQSIQWSQSELDNTLCVVTGDNGSIGLDMALLVETKLYVDKVNFVFGVGGCG